MAILKYGRKLGAKWAAKWVQNERKMGAKFGREMSAKRAQNRLEVRAVFPDKTLNHSDISRARSVAKREPDHILTSAQRELKATLRRVGRRTAYN